MEEGIGGIVLIRVTVISHKRHDRTGKPKRDQSLLNLCGTIVVGRFF